MRYIAAYLLAVLGGNKNPSSSDIEKILGSVGIEVEDERLEKVVSELNGKDINEVIERGKARLACLPAGGGAVATVGGSLPTQAAGMEPSDKEEKEERKEESEESDDDMGFGLFD